MNELLSPIVVLGIFLMVSYALYKAGGRLAPKVPQSEDKLMGYASGEKVEATKITQSYSLFHVAFIFTIFHVAILLLVMVPSNEDAVYAMAFLGALIISAYALVTGGEPSD